MIGFAESRELTVQSFRQIARARREEGDLDGAHRFELRADDYERGQDVPELNGYWPDAATQER
jgi:hypothetical protein